MHHDRSVGQLSWMFPSFLHVISSNIIFHIFDQHQDCTVWWFIFINLPFPLIFCTRWPLFVMFCDVIASDYMSLQKNLMSFPIANNSFVSHILWHYVMNHVGEHIMTERIYFQLKGTPCCRNDWYESCMKIINYLYI